MVPASVLRYGSDPECYVEVSMDVENNTDVHEITIKHLIIAIILVCAPILIEVTRRPDACRSTPILLAVTPFPSPLTTPAQGGGVGCVEQLEQGFETSN